MAAAINTAAANSATARAGLAATSDRHQQALAAGAERAKVALETPRSYLRELRRAVHEELERLTPDVEGALSRAERGSVKAARRTLASADDLDLKVTAFLHPLDARSAGPVSDDLPDASAPERSQPEAVEVRLEAEEPARQRTARAHRRSHA
jgi:hypothetical protein